MVHQSGRGFAVVAVLLLLAGAAAAQEPLPPFFEPPTPPPTGGTGEVVPPPDLLPGNARLYGTNETAPTTLCVDVYNAAGDERTIVPPFDVQLFLDGFDEGAERVTKDLGAGEAAEVCWERELAAGNHTFHVVVDPADEVEEARENNNVAPTRLFRVRPAPGVDLVIENLVVFPRVAKLGEPQAFTVRLRNVGELTSPPSVVDLVDQTGHLARLNVKQLAPGERRSVSFVGVPDQHASGNFLVTATVDPDATLAELNESNNAFTADFTIPEHPAADLRILDVQLGGTPVAGRTLKLNVTVANAGDRDAGGFVVRVLDGERPIANVTQNLLRMGSNVTLQAVFTLAEGTHTLRAVADADRRVVERNETDNERALVVDIAGTPEQLFSTNLYLASLDAAPNDPRPGEVVTIVALVRNPTEAATNATDLVVTVNGVHLATSRVAALAPGRSASIPLSWPVDAPGSYTLRARVDPDGTLAESDEEDNELVSTFIVLEPTAPPPPPKNDTPPTNVTPTVPTPSTPTPPTNGGGGVGALPVGSVAIDAVEVVTRAVPGGTRGIITASIRNPDLAPVGGLIVSFRVDGQTVKEVLHNGLGGAATTTVSSGEMELPTGDHEAAVEITVRGSSAAPTVSSKRYQAEAGESGVPGPGALAALVAVAAAAAILARRRG